MDNIEISWNLKCLVLHLLLYLASKILNTESEETVYHTDFIMDGDTSRPTSRIRKEVGLYNV